MEESNAVEETNIRVAVRCRPLSTKEKANAEQSCVKIQSGVITLTATNEEEHKFGFDLLFGIDSRQDEVWTAIGLPVLQKAIAGYNGTIFAYGNLF